MSDDNCFIADYCAIYHPNTLAMVENPDTIPECFEAVVHFDETLMLASQGIEGLRTKCKTVVSFAITMELIYENRVNTGFILARTDVTTQEAIKKEYYKLRNCTLAEGRGIKLLDKYNVWLLRAADCVN